MGSGANHGGGDQKGTAMSTGAGPHCDAQIMVWQDMAGLTTGRLPRFVKRYADVRATLLDAAHRYVTEVAVQHYPDPAHSYT